VGKKDFLTKKTIFRAFPFIRPDAKSRRTKQTDKPYIEYSTRFDFLNALFPIFRFFPSFFPFFAFFPRMGLDKSSPSGYYYPKHFTCNSPGPFPK